MSKRYIGRSLQELRALFRYRLSHLTSSVGEETAAVPNKHCTETCLKLKMNMFA